MPAKERRPKEIGRMKTIAAKTMSDKVRPGLAFVALPNHITDPNKEDLDDHANYRCRQQCDHGVIAKQVPDM